MEKTQFFDEDYIDRDFCDFSERLLDMNARKPEYTRSVLFEQSLQMDSGRPICFHTGGVFVDLPFHSQYDRLEDEDEDDREYQF